MKFHYSDEEFTYTGAELHPLFTYMRFGILGDSILAWCGPCEVKFSEMVDGEDRRAGAKICGDKMLHFLIEIFDTNLFSAVTLQRLLATMVKEEIENEIKGLLQRNGDDLFWGNRKLSISIATSSPTSQLIHFAVNVVNSGTPVPTAALEDFRLTPVSLAKKIGERFVAEVNSIREACQKVFPVS